MALEVRLTLWCTSTALAIQACTLSSGQEVGQWVPPHCSPHPKSPQDLRGGAFQRKEQICCSGGWLIHRRESFYGLSTVCKRNMFLACTLPTSIRIDSVLLSKIHQLAPLYLLSEGTTKFIMSPKVDRGQNSCLSSPGLAYNPTEKPTKVQEAGLPNHLYQQAEHLALQATGVLLAILYEVWSTVCTILLVSISKQWPDVK